MVICERHGNHIDKIHEKSYNIIIQFKMILENKVRKDTMHKEKFRLENKLGTSGVMTTIILVITTIITGLLFSVSAFLRFVLHDSVRMQNFLETFGIENTKIQNIFDISDSISWLGSAPTLIVLSAIIFLLLVIWISFYKLNSVYIYRAFRGYGISLMCISGLSFVLGIFISPIMYHFANEAYLNYENAFKAGKWIMMFSVVPVFMLGLLMLLISLFAAFPAKTDMKRPRRNGEKDVSFIMDDDDIKRIYENSALDETPQTSDVSEKTLENDSAVKALLPDNEICSSASDGENEKIQTAEAEIADKHCPNCSVLVNDGDIFCTECGTKL